MHDKTLLGVCGLVLALTVLYPTGRLVLEALRIWQWPAVTSGRGFEAMINTAAVSVASVIASGIMGTAMALLLTRFTFPGRNVLAAVAYLPFTLPPLVGVLSFWYILGQDGFIAHTMLHLFGVRGVWLADFPAILVIHTYSFYVFFYAMVSSALESMDRSLIEAARSLGASRWRVFTRVTLPLLRPSLVGASLLTFMSSGASFSAPFFFGFNYPVLSTEIFYRQLEGPAGRPAALTLTVVLALVALLGILVFRSGRRTEGSASKGVRTPLRSTAGRTLAGASAWIVVALLLTPHAVIAALSFADFRAWQTEIIPPQWTWANYALIFEDRNMLRPIVNSLWMSGLATVAVVCVGLPAAYLIGRRRPGGWWLNVLVMIPWALPGTVIAINLIVAFNDPWLPLYSTVWLVPMAYFIRSIPIFARMASAAIEPFDAGLIEAGRSLGAPPLYCYIRIVLPLIAPAVAAGAALVFATSLGEFVASILLYMPSNMPISVKINEQWRGAGLGAAFAYSVFLMTLVALTFIASRRFASRAA